MERILRLGRWCRRHGIQYFWEHGICTLQGCRTSYAAVVQRLQFYPALGSVDDSE